jgi:hypothetical protein
MKQTFLSAGGNQTSWGRLFGRAGRRGVAKQARGEVGEKQGVLVNYWVLSLLLLGPLSAWIHASEPWDPWNNPYGICTHQTTPEALRVIKAAGIGWLRIDITWSGLEPRRIFPCHFLRSL